MTSKMNSNDEAQARARRAQVLAAAADVFARTAITPEALAAIARMSKQQIIEELIAYHIDRRGTGRREAEPRPRTRRSATGDDGRGGAQSLKHDALIAAVRRVVRAVLTPGN